MAGATGMTTATANSRRSPRTQQCFDAPDLFASVILYGQDCLDSLQRAPARRVLHVAGGMDGASSGLMRRRFAQAGAHAERGYSRPGKVLTAGRASKPAETRLGEETSTSRCTFQATGTHALGYFRQRRR